MRRQFCGGGLLRQIRRPVNASSIARYLRYVGGGDWHAGHKMNFLDYIRRWGVRGGWRRVFDGGGGADKELLGGSLTRVCIAAEVRWNMTATCDPVAGRVPKSLVASERNAIGKIKAVNAARMALRRTSEPRFRSMKRSETMYETGKGMNDKYRDVARQSGD